MNDLGGHMSRVKDMTSGSPLRLMVLFAIPLILGNLGQQLYMIVDTIIVGQGVGVEALASLGATDWTYWLFLWIVQAITQGCSIRVTQDFGSKDYSQLRKSITMSIRICIFVTLIVTVVGLISGKRLLILLQTPENLMQGALTYFYIMLGGIVISVCYNMSAAILRSFGDGKTPLLAMGIAAIVNILLDLLFVMVFHWGIAGAAIATLIAQALSFIYCLHVLRKLDFLQFDKSDWIVDTKRIQELVKLGAPLMFQNMVIAGGGMVLQSVINKYGIIFVAGFTATNKLYGLLETSAISFGYATTTYTAQNWGAKKIKRIVDGLRTSTILSLVLSVVVGIFLIVVGRQLLTLFIASESYADQVLDVAYKYLFIMSLFLPALYLLYTYRCTLQGLGNTVAPMISGFIEFFMRVISALVFPLVIGSTGIFYAEVTAWVGAMIYLMVSCLSNVKRIQETVVESE